MVDPRRPPGARAAGKHRALYVCSMYIYIYMKEKAFPFQPSWLILEDLLLLCIPPEPTPVVLLCVKGPAKVKTVFRLFIPDSGLK